MKRPDAVLVHAQTVQPDLTFMDEPFSNLNIETVRNEVDNQNAPKKPNAEGETPKVQLVNFTIRTAYTPSKAAGANTGAPTAASAAGAPAAAPQVAKN